MPNLAYADYRHSTELLSRSALSTPEFDTPVASAQTTSSNPADWAEAIALGGGGIIRQLPSHASKAYVLSTIASGQDLNVRVAHVTGAAGLICVRYDSRELRHVTPTYPGITYESYSSVMSIPLAAIAQGWVVDQMKSPPIHKSSAVAKFKTLVSDWRASRNQAGSVFEMAMHPAYQQIIGMGQDAVPLILFELEESVDHWFWALAAITGANPVPDSHRGRLKLMTQDWIMWAKRQGYRW
jgi:hypothetical protein